MLPGVVRVGAAGAWGVAGGVVRPLGAVGGGAWGCGSGEVMGSAEGALVAAVAVVVVAGGGIVGLREGSVSSFPRGGSSSSSPGGGSSSSSPGGGWSASGLGGEGGLVAACVVESPGGGRASAAGVVRLGVGCSAPAGMAAAAAMERGA